MSFDEIQKFEDEIKELYFRDNEEILKEFWHIHLKPVINKSKELAQKYKANMEVVWLASILHDIGQFEDLENHDTVGSEMAYDILIEKGYGEELAKQVKETILTHRVKKYLPETLEQKILASADAIVHFTTPHYIWMARVSKKPLDVLFEKFAGKIEGDINKKIFFEDEKKMVEAQYQILKGWFDQKF